MFLFSVSIKFLYQSIVDACFNGNFFSSTFLFSSISCLIVRGAVKKIFYFKDLNKFQLLTPAIKLSLSLSWIRQGRVYINMNKNILLLSTEYLHQIYSEILSDFSLFSNVTSFLLITCKLFRKIIMFLM